MPWRHRALNFWSGSYSEGTWARNLNSFGVQVNMTVVVVILFLYLEWEKTLMKTRLIFFWLKQFMWETEAPEKTLLLPFNASSIQYPHQTHQHNLPDVYPLLKAVFFYRTIFLDLFFNHTPNCKILVWFLALSWFGFLYIIHFKIRCSVPYPLTPFPSALPIT